MSFADHLRSRSPEELGRLLTARPDLLAAADGGIEAVARKAMTLPSLGRCLLRADLAMLVVAEALAVTSPASAAEIDELLGTDDVDAVVDALLRLERNGIVVLEHGVAAALRGLDDLLYRPLGLGLGFVELAGHLAPDALDALAARVGVAGARTHAASAGAVARRLRDRSTIDRLLEDAPAPCRQMLASLAEQRSPAVGLPPGYRYRSRDLGDPLTWLLDTGLLVAVNDGVAELPREIVIAFHGDGLAPGARLRPIELRPVDGAAAAQVAAEAADRAARAIEGAGALVRKVGEGAVAVRRSGGVGVRELGRLGKELDFEPRRVGQLLELLHQARLVRVRSATLETTPLADRWWNLDRAHRWLVLIRSWQRASGFLSVAGSPDAQGRARPALGHDEPAAAADLARQRVLSMIATLDDGEAYDPEQLTEAVVWSAPSLWGVGETPPEELVAWVVDELEFLGLAARYGSTAALVTLSSGDHDALDRLSGELLGSDQRQFVLQSELTAHALGPLEPAVAADLAAMADRQAGLAAPTFRFTSASLRRALDRGWAASEITAFLGEHALSGVPQELQDLIDEAERRHGAVRVFAATSVIVADDEAIAVEIASTKRAARLGLQLIAPTVIVAPVEPERLADELRAEGLSPVISGSTLSVGFDAGPHRLSDVGAGEDQGDSGDGAEQPPLPADWTGPPLDDAALAGEVSDAVISLLDEPDPVLDRSGHRFDLLWNRWAVVRVMRDGALVEVRGTIVAVDDTLTLVGEAGIEEVPLDAVVSVEDPTR